MLKWHESAFALINVIRFRHFNHLLNDITISSFNLLLQIVDECIPNGALRRFLTVIDVQSGGFSRVFTRRVNQLIKADYKLDFRFDCRGHIINKLSARFVVE